MTSLRISPGSRLLLAGPSVAVGAAAGTLVQLVFYALDAGSGYFAWGAAHIGFLAVALAGYAASFAVSSVPAMRLRSLALGFVLGLPVAFLVVMTKAILTGTFVL
ncbi:hypothetical protein GCM10027020_31640 [Nocardioides salsibiostraticola]